MPSMLRARSPRTRTGLNLLLRVGAAPAHDQRRLQRAVVRELARSKASERAALEADGVPSSRSPERLRAWRDVVEEEAALTHAAAIAELAPVVDDVCEARL